MIKSIFNTGLSKVVNLTIALVVGVIIGRVYGPEGKGIITLLILIPTMISVYAGFSLGEGFLYYIGYEKISKENFNSLLLKILPSFSILIVITFFIFYYFFVDYKYFIIPQILLMLSLFTGNILKFCLKAVLDFKRFNLIQILEPFIIFIGLLLVLAIKADIKYLVWAYLISSFVQNVILYFSVLLKLNNIETNTNIVQVFSYSYKVHFFGIMNFTEAKFDVLFIGYLLNMIAVGVYSVAVSITVIFQTVIQTSISTVLYPIIVKSDPLKKVSLTVEYFKLSFFLALLFLVFMLLFGNLIIVYIYGSSFRDAYVPMMILLVGALIKSPNACINSYFKAIGKPKELYKTSIVSLSINIILCLIAIPSYGILGAAISSSISYFIYGCIMQIKFKRETNTGYLELILLNKQDIKNIFLLVKNIIPKNG